MTDITPERARELATRRAQSAADLREYLADALRAAADRQAALEQGIANRDALLDAARAESERLRATLAAREELLIKALGVLKDGALRGRLAITAEIEAALKKETDDE